jgi:hypothetical protein
MPTKEAQNLVVNKGREFLDLKKLKITMKVEQTFGEGGRQMEF